LDDPTVLLAAKQLSADLHVPKPGVSGRYVPAYNLLNALLFKIFKYELYGFYFIQSLFVLASMALVYYLAKNMTGSVSSGIFAVFLATTASPVAENVYTLGKSEPIILFCLLFQLAVFTAVIQSPKDRQRGMRIAAHVLILLTLFVAALTKETAGVYIVFAFTGLLLAMFMTKKDRADNEGVVKNYFTLLSMNVCAVIAARLLFYVLKHPDSIDSYTSYSITYDLFVDNLRYYVKQQPDVLILGIVSAILLPWLLLRRDKIPMKVLLFTSALFAQGTAYVVGLLLWRWPMGYYLFIPSTLFSLTAVTTLSLITRNIQLRKIGAVLMAVILATGVYGIIEFWYLANAQKAQDMMYTEAILEYVKRASPGERLLVEDWTFFEEPVSQSNILVRKILSKDALAVEGIQDVIYGTEIPENIKILYGVTDKAIQDKLSRAPRPNDYVLAFSGSRSARWALRGVAPYLNTNDSFYASNYQVQKIIEDEVAWYGVQFAGFSAPSLQRYTSKYQLVQIKESSPPPVWERRWIDGLMGRKATCYVWVAEKNKIIFRGHASEHIVPASLTITHAGKTIKTVRFASPGPFSIDVTGHLRPSQEWARLDLEIDKTYNLHTMNISPDGRDIGIRITLHNE
jgi:hypothetical protein